MFDLNTTIITDYVDVSPLYACGNMAYQASGEAGGDVGDLGTEGIDTAGSSTDLFSACANRSTVIVNWLGEVLPNFDPERAGEINTLTENILPYFTFPVLIFSGVLAGNARYNNYINPGFLTTFVFN